MASLSAFEEWLFAFNTFGEYRDTVRDLPAFSRSVQTLIEDFGEGEWEVPDEAGMQALHAKFWTEMAPEADD